MIKESFRPSDSAAAGATFSDSAFLGALVFLTAVTPSVLAAEAAFLLGAMLAQATARRHWRPLREAGSPDA